MAPVLTRGLLFVDSCLRSCILIHEAKTPSQRLVLARMPFITLDI